MKIISFRTYNGTIIEGEELQKGLALQTATLGDTQQPKVFLCAFAVKVA